MLRPVWPKALGEQLPPTKDGVYYKVRFLSAYITHPAEFSHTGLWQPFNVIGAKDSVIPTSVGEDPRKFSSARDALNTAITNAVDWKAIYGNPIADKANMDVAGLQRIEYIKRPLLFPMIDIVLYSEDAKGPLSVVYRIVPTKYKPTKDKNTAEVIYTIDKSPWPCPVWAGDMNRFPLINSQDIVTTIFGDGWEMVAGDYAPFASELFRRYTDANRSELAQVIAIDGSGIDDPLPEVYRSIIAKNLIDTDAVVKIIFARQDLTGNDYFALYSGPIEDFKTDGD